MAIFNCYVRRLAKLEELGRMHRELRRARLPHARAVPGGTLHADARSAGRSWSNLGRILPGKMAMDCWENHRKTIGKP